MPTHVPTTTSSNELGARHVDPTSAEPRAQPDAHAQVHNAPEVPLAAHAAAGAAHPAATPASAGDPFAGAPAHVSQSVIDVLFELSARDLRHLAFAAAFSDFPAKLDMLEVLLREAELRADGSPHAALRARDLAVSTWLDRCVLPRGAHAAADGPALRSPPTPRDAAALRDTDTHGTDVAPPGDQAATTVDSRAHVDAADTEAQSIPESPTAASDDGSRWFEHPASPTLVSTVAAFQHLTQQEDFEQRGAFAPPPVFPMLLHAAATLPPPPLATLRTLTARPVAVATAGEMYDPVEAAAQYLQYTAVHRHVDEGLAALEVTADYVESITPGIPFDMFEFFAAAAYPGAENLVRLIDVTPGPNDQEACCFQLRALRLLRRTLSWGHRDTSDTEWLDAVVSADVMPVLAQLVEHPDTEIKTDAIETFCALVTSVSDLVAESSLNDDLDAALSLDVDESFVDGLFAIAGNDVLPIRARRVAIEGLKALAALNDAEAVPEFARSVLDIAEAAHPPSIVDEQWEEFQQSMVDTVQACLASGATGVETLIGRYCSILCCFGSDPSGFLDLVCMVMDGDGKLDISDASVRSAIVAALLTLLRNAQSDLDFVVMLLENAVLDKPNGDRLRPEYGPDVLAALLHIIQTSVAQHQPRAIAAADGLYDLWRRANEAEGRHAIASCDAATIVVQAVLAASESLDYNVFLWLLIRLAHSVTGFAEDVRRADAALGLPLQSALATARDSTAARVVHAALFGEDGDAEQAQDEMTIRMG